MKYLLSVFLLLTHCAFAEQWLIDGQKKITVHDPAGFRSQIEAVASSSGQSTNLTVSDTLTVVGIVGSTSATISGLDAGDYAGEYSYAGTDGYYGNYFTNSAGKYLFIDADWWWSGDWSLGPSVDSAAVGYFLESGVWYDTNFDPVDVTRTGTPSYGLNHGDLHVAGGVSIGAEDFVDAMGGLPPGCEFSVVTHDNATNSGGSIVASKLYGSVNEAYDLTVSGAINNSLFGISARNPLSGGGSIDLHSVSRSIGFADAFWDGSVTAAVVGAIAGISAGNPAGECYFGGGSGVYLVDSYNTQTSICNPYSGANRLISSVAVLTGGNTMTGLNMGNVLALAGDSSGGPDITSENLEGCLIAQVEGGTFKGTGLLGAGSNNTQTHDYTGVVGDGMTTFKDNAIYAGSFIATTDGSASTTNCRFYFGSDSWLFTSGTNLMFRNSAGNIGAVNITY